MKASIRIAQRAVNLGAAGALLWFATPLLAFGSWHPFDDVRARVALLALAALLLFGLRGTRLLLARRRNERLLKSLESGDAGPELSQRFRQALAMLRQGIEAQGTKRWWQNRRQVQQLPWYLIIGAPGGGKTTALLHSGLRFPLAEKLGRDPLAGTGGTRQCDWWFSQDAVFIDTAGRYTTQDSDADADAREWQQFLALLRRHRPVQPINGVIVSVSVPDLLHGGAELARQAAAVAARLEELRLELDLAFPIYLLVTKADLLAGFVETFGDLDAAQREHLWGLVFDADVAGIPADLGPRLADLAQRLARRGPEALQHERTPQRRLPIYAFAAQFEALLAPLEGFVRKAFAGIAAEPAQRLRSIALTSGTQEGNPIDRVIGELARSHGLALKPLARPDAGGKSFFLHALLKRLVIAEAPLAGQRLERLRWRRRATLVGAGVAGTALLAASALWWQSYRRNLDYVDAVRTRVEQLTQRIGSLESASLEQVWPLYSLLERLAANDGIDPNEPPVGFGFGLFQGPRLARSAEQAYREMLDRSLAPLLVQRLRRDLRGAEDSATRYEALRASLMLASPERLVRGELRPWAEQLVQAGGAGERAEWARHVDALLERSGLPEAMRSDDAGVRAARSALAALPLAQRVHERLLRRVSDAEPPQDLPTRLGAAGALVFAASSAGPMPLHSSAGDWRRKLLPAIEPTLDELANEAEWVLGDTGSEVRRLKNDRGWRDDIATQVGKRQAQRVIDAWSRQLDALALAPGTDADGASRQATELTAPDSPLRRLFTRLADEFSATAQGGSVAEATFDAALRARFGELGDYAAGAGPQALDRLHALAIAKRGDTANAELDATLRAETARAPAALRKVYIGLGTLIRSRGGPKPSFDAALAELAQTCSALTRERFPFGDTSSRDMAPSDFARLFGPGGLFDEFRRNQLTERVDMSSRPWKARSAAADAGMPGAFEQAAAIGTLFFPGGAPLPELRLRLTPQRMDAELLQFSIDVDGQLLRFENGPTRAKELVWPGPASTQKVLMRILPPGPARVGAEIHEGPFAWLRVLLRGDWKGERGATARLAFVVDTRTLDVEASASGAPDADIWTLRELARFRCPQARW